MVDEVRIGQVFGGKWRALSVLGRGATSTVYAAQRNDDGLLAAVKVFRQHLSQHPRVLRLLLAEARLVGTVEHPGTVKVLDEGVAEDGCAFLVFELLVGQTLDDFRQAYGGRIPIEEVMPVGDAIMDALAAVHAAGIVHRDLKPANIFVLQGGGVKLLDFGFAKLRGYTADAAQNVVGTPSFMSPEAALGLTKKVDAQSDVWSLGATLFQALSGQSVHNAKHMDAMILASASERPRSLADAAPELPSKIVSVVDRALAYRKADRWPDIVSMRTAWHDAHPHWLPTLPPPSFTADESFLDSALLESDVGDAMVGARGDEAIVGDAIAGHDGGLFDPRELLQSLEPKPKHPGPIPSKAKTRD